MLRSFNPVWSIEFQFSSAACVVCVCVYVCFGDGGEIFFSYYILIWIFGFLLLRLCMEVFFFLFQGILWTGRLAQECLLKVVNFSFIKFWWC